MKKLVYRAGAVIMAALLFFCSMIYSAVPVHAFGLVEVAIQAGWAALGYFVGKGIDEVAQKLGWTSADIQVDENGNVILSESQMNELKAALEAETTDSNGNDLYGQYIYQPTASFEEFMAAHADDSRLQNSSDIYKLNVNEIWVRDYSSLGQLCFSQAPLAAVWIGPQGGGIQFWDAAGMTRLNASYVAYAYNPQYAGSGTLTSGMSNGSYCGAGHVAFTTLEAYKNWKNDGEPYTRCVPTYTGGSLTIPADSMKDTDGDGTPDSEDEDDDGDGIPDDEDDTPKGDVEEKPTTEVGWLEKIYNKLDEILKQVKQIKWIGVVDTVIDAIDAFGDEVGSGIAGVVDAVTGILSEVFPLCFIWDIFLVLDMFEAEPVEPVFTISLDFTALGLSEPYELVIDLTEYDSLFAMFRVFELLFFMGGLWNLTYSWIVGKGDTV